MRVPATPLRWLAGSLGAVLAGWPLFRGNVLAPSHPAFQCVTVGGLLALIVALQRGGRAGAALGVVWVFTVIQIGMHWNAGWPGLLVAPLAGLLLGLGAWITAYAYDLLARHGHLLGKFVFTSMMFGGVYFAVSPLSILLQAETLASFRYLVQNTIIGFIIGLGVGVAVEVVDLFQASRATSVEAAGR